MQKKTIIIVSAIVVVVIAATTTVLHFVHSREMNQLSSQVATLNSTLDAIGPIVTCYTVSAVTFPGQEIGEDLIVKQSIPESLTNKTFAKKEDIVGKYSKVSISPGTPITTDMVMKDKILDSERDIDITANRWPIGLKVGDYVDLRITYPRGEDFIVLSHKRVMSMVNQTIKINASEEEQVLYQSALVDFYLSRGYGSDIYLTRYIEPGIQADAKVFYSIPTRIATVVAQDPNIVDKAQVSVAKNLRSTIDAARAKFGEGDPSGADVKGGRDELNGKVNSDYGVDATNKEKAAAEKDKSKDDSSLVTNLDQGVQ